MIFWSSEPQQASFSWAEISFIPNLALPNLAYPTLAYPNLAKSELGTAKPQLLVTLCLSYFLSFFVCHPPTFLVWGCH